VTGATLLAASRCDWRQRLHASAVGGPRRPCVFFLQAAAAAVGVLIYSDGLWFVLVVEGRG
jgi:hypothetical protein